MNKETRAALERLEAQLLEIDQQQAQTEQQRLDALLEDFLNEPDFDEFIEPAPPQKRAVYQPSFDDGKTRVIGSDQLKAYNADPFEDDLDAYSDEVYEEPAPERLSGLLITAAALLLANACVLLWWVFKLL